MAQPSADISARISSILEHRHIHLPVVHTELERWQQIDNTIEKLAHAVHELYSHTQTPLEAKQALAAFQVKDIRKEIAAALEQLRIVEARYTRRTINIGVSGRARVGKSTMLQSISGLTDQQIPTGKVLPVTAVRSRIFHSTSHQRATLRLHSFDTFREQLLAPYHLELGLPGIPASIEEFKRWPYPRVEDLLSEEGQLHSSSTLLGRLREMQQALWSYEKDLTGGERPIELAELRKYVAYPSNEEVESNRCPRHYLAVQDVRIECTFPHAQIDHLGIIDLPGLGELAPNTEQHHLNGLQNEVDVVLLVKRPVEGMAFWGREDGNATNLLDRARGSIRNRGDFVFIVINNDGADPVFMTPMRDDIRRKANDGIDGKHFRVLECDAADQRSVYDNVLAPVLSHLTERLPVMDREVFEGARTRYAALSSRIHALLGDLETDLRSISRSAQSSIEYVDEQTAKLHKNVATALVGLVNTLQIQARTGEEDDAYLAAIDTVYNDISRWISDGFGQGKEQWCSQALSTMIKDKNSSPFAAEELNRIRVEISQRYCSLDLYFHSRIEQLWNQIAELLKPNLGTLLEDLSGEAALRRLGSLLNDASEPCPTLSKAVEELLALQLEYRAHLHPLVRRELDGLNLQITDPVSGSEKAQIIVSRTEAGAVELYDSIAELAEQAAHYTKQALVPKALIPTLVVHAAAEQFEDTLIRSGASSREFKRFARSYQNDLWPGEYQGIDENNARFTKIMKAIHTIRKSLEDI